MLLVNKTNLDIVTRKDVDAQIYVNVPHSDKWKVDLAKEILEVKNKKLEMQILNYNEFDEILEAIVT